MKVKVVVEEKLVFVDEMIVERPENMDDSTFEELVRKIGGKAKQFHEQATDIGNALEKEGIQVVKKADTFPDYPKYTDIEITKVEEME